MAFLGLAMGACSSVRPEMPPEPDQGGVPTGEIAYVVQYRWSDVPKITDMVLVSGILYGIEDSTRVTAYLSNKADPVVNAGLSLPDSVVVNGERVGRPVQLAEGPASTLWVAYLDPNPQLVQFTISPPQTTGLRVRNAAIRAIGGIAADRDSDFVYVADPVANTITKYAPSEAGGARVAVLATEGNGDHFVREPHGLYYFSDSLLVADTAKGWLQVLSADVPFSGRGQVLGPLEAPLVLQNPVDVWLDKSGRFYVAESGDVLQVNSAGVIKEIVTELDPEPGQTPPAVVANTTQVWVPDPARNRLTIYQINTVGEGLP
jgi:hypothetical protein